MIVEVGAIFDSCIRARFAKRQDLVDFLLKHERKNICIENCCEQIKIAEMRAGFKFGKTQYAMMISEMANWFAKAAINAKVVELMSSAERHRIESQNDKNKEIESLLKEVSDDQGNPTTGS